MSEVLAPPISQTEHEVLQLLDTANCILNNFDGRVRWALDGDDVVVLLELGAELVGATVDPDVSNRLACLLGGGEQ
jgi:hypothetical protein